MSTKNKNYDYTAKDRVARERETLIKAGGTRAETTLNAEEAARLDAYVASGRASSRREALRAAVRLLPDPPAAEE
jgi:predicted phage gp36 major capsid-like protein